MRRARTACPPRCTGWVWRARATDPADAVEGHKPSARGGPPGWPEVGRGGPRCARKRAAVCPRAHPGPGGGPQIRRTQAGLRGGPGLRATSNDWAKVARAIHARGRGRAHGREVGSRGAPKCTRAGVNGAEAGRGAPEQLRTDPPQSPADAGRFQRDSNYPMCGQYQARWGANGGRASAGEQTSGLTAALGRRLFEDRRVKSGLQVSECRTGADDPNRPCPQPRCARN